MRYTVLTSLIIILLSMALQAQYYKNPAYFGSEYRFKNNMAVGISDPRMEDDSLALELAVLRAKSLIGMMQGVDVSCVSELYTTKHEAHRTFVENHKHQKMGRISSHFSYHPDEFQIVAMDSNRNGELFVYLRYKPNPSLQRDAAIDSYIDYYSQDYEISNTRALSKTTMITHVCTDSSKAGSKEYCYRLHSDNHTTELSTELDSSVYQPPTYTYAYSDTDEKSSIENCEMLADLTYGMWQALFDAHIHALCKRSLNKNFKVEILDDIYGNKKKRNSDALGATQLTRQIASNTLEFSLHRLFINNNRLYLDIHPDLSTSSWDNTGQELDEKPVQPRKSKRGFWDWLFGRNK